MRYQFIITYFLLFFLSPLVSYADYMEVTLLGTGTPRPSIERFGPATVIEANGRYFIFDSGRGTTIRLQQAGIPLSKVEHVFLTHLHSDHVGGLADLWLTSWIWQRSKPLVITGPKGTEQLSKHLIQAYQSDYLYRSKNTGLSETDFAINSHDIKQEGIVFQSGSIVIKAFLVDHYPVEPAYGYRIDFGKRSIVISGDTTYSENLIKHAKNVDLLVHEIAAVDPTLLKTNPKLEKVMSYHTSPEQAGQLLSLIQPQASVFTHVLLFGVTEKSILETIYKYYDGKTFIGHDLMRIGVGEKTRVDMP